MAHTVHATLVAALLVLAGCASVPGMNAGGAGDATTAAPTTVGASNAGSGGTGATGGAGQAVACDYRSLYDRTIDSIVQVRTNGGLGSGFVYRTDGATSYVVTNHHVVANATGAVDVQFNRGESRRGEIVGTDAYSDLAVIRVSDTPGYVEALPVAEDNPEPGTKVAALGSPFGLEATITQGIVSGVNRSMPTERGFTIPDTVQTDAPINPGNSGGPLVTCDAVVVGVNRAGGGDNVGFAISASLLRQVVPALVEDGEYNHPYLGVGTFPVTQTLARANGLNTTQGVYVSTVVQGGPADGVLRGTSRTEVVDGQQVPAGGDVVVAVDGRRIHTSEQFGSYLATETRPGEEVTLTVVRDGERSTVTVTLGERPPPDSSGSES